MGQGQVTVCTATGPFDKGTLRYHPLAEQLISRRSPVCCLRPHRARLLNQAESSEGLLVALQVLRQVQGLLYL